MAYAVLMHSEGLFVLAQADYTHLCQSALVLSMIVGVGFDTVYQDDSI